MLHTLRYHVATVTLKVYFQDARRYLILRRTACAECYRLLIVMSVLCALCDIRVTSNDGSADAEKFYKSYKSYKIYKNICLIRVKFMIIRVSKQPHGQKRKKFPHI